MHSNLMTTDWFLYILAAVAAALPLPLIEIYIKHNKKEYLIYAILCYVVLTILYIKILKTKYMISVYPFIKILSILIVVFVSILFFGQTLHRNGIIGLLLGFAALYLLTHDEK